MDTTQVLAFAAGYFFSLMIHRHSEAKARKRQSMAEIINKMGKPTNHWRG